ncbi:hypothetical protein FIBSPDRAFT_710647, partial [Athelia psychrophila]
VSARFSCGVRTSGRVESENRVNKLFGNSKTTLFGLVKELIHHSDDQDTNKKLSARKVHINTVSFALQHSYTQMEHAVFYRVAELPRELSEWTGLNDFSNDTFSISAQYLVSLIQGRGLQIKQYFKVSHYDSGVVHYVVVLAGGQYVCDCMMGINLGIPCRHFFAVLYMGTGISFHIGL